MKLVPNLRSVEEINQQIQVTFPRQLRRVFQFYHILKIVLLSVSSDEYRLKNLTFI